MRLLHIVKTSNGASWAAAQVRELVQLGLDIHVVLPSPSGCMMDAWRASGAALHFLNLDFPARSPWRLPSVIAAARRIIADIRPDLIHTHFVGPTLVVRHAMKNSGPVRVFQVPGPLHLEHAFYRGWDLMTAMDRDYWVGSSQYIGSLYRKAGVPKDRLFISYYGTDTEVFNSTTSGFLRKRLGIPASHRIVGNISYIYPPKYHVGQFVGLKGHETLIDALALVVNKHRSITGALIGSTWGKNSASAYERRLRSRCFAAAGERILMPGYFSPVEVQKAWPEFDCAVHVPLSENCGGVVEPLLASVPTVAGRVGGLPEVVIDGVTGRTAPGSDPGKLAEAILSVLENPEESKRMAAVGEKLVRTMFDVRRTSREVYGIYRHLLGSAIPRPTEFDPVGFTAPCRAEHTIGLS